MKGPDHSFALEPHELKMMVQGVRTVETALGSHIKQMLRDEGEMARLGRRSIIARVRILQGTVVTPDMLTTKRPGYGIRPKFLPSVIGRTVRRTIEEDEVITWDLV
jgi:sialic acid synthase SpsE